MDRVSSIRKLAHPKAEGSGVRSCKIAKESK